MSAAPVVVDTSLSRDGVAGIGLEGTRVALTIFPEAGGKILDLVHRPSGRNLLWRNPRVPVARTYPGAPFEDVWCGGWDDLFPTDPPCTIDGNAYHDHGDLWVGSWEWQVEEDSGERATVRLARHSLSLPCLMEKWVTVFRDEPFVALRHRLSNYGPRRVSFMWDLHVAHAIEPGSRIHLPAKELEVEAPYLGRAGEGVTRCAWPAHTDRDGAVHDLSCTPDAGEHTEFLWAPRLEEGWCAVLHPQAGVGLGLAFDASVFPTVWLFADYGGWRGHYFLLTEPCTSPPGSLAQAVQRGTAATLDPGEALETHVVATVLDDIDANRPAHERPGRLVVPQEATTSMALN